jgi:excinuclease ABC subunit C
METPAPRRLPPDHFLSRLPHKPGVYVMRDKTGGILYIGKALDLRKRVANYFRSNVDTKVRALMDEVRHIDFIPAENERESLVVEQRLIHRHKPAFNTMWRDDKSYPFLEVTMDEDFPRARLTRGKKRPGARTFGPFPRVKPVKKLLHWIWNRHLFPLRPCDLEFSEKKLPPAKKVASCLYLHTGECPAPCVGKISSRDYKEIAGRAVLFFEGKHGQLKEMWEREMKAAAGRMEFERAQHFRDNLRALDQLHQPVTFRALRPEDVQSRLQATQALQDLQTALGLPRPPLRIEAFDISHVQGAETVASMVSFERGRPLKSGYRKFIIRTVKGVDDFASMEEVVSRRYARLKADGGPWPDLVLIDGGAGQLSAAQKALKKLGLTAKLPMASLAKEEEEIYRPGVSEPIRLSKESAALQVLQHVRDESHRFAVTFHRQRRGKSVFAKKEKEPANENTVQNP